MLPGIRSQMGRAASDARKPLLFQCLVGSAEHQNILWRMLKWRHLKTEFWSFIFGTAFWVRLGVKLALCNNAQNCRENGVFMFPILKLPHEAQNQGLKKWQKCLRPRPSSFLCFWVARLDFAKTKKTYF